MLDHVVLTVSDLERALRFYERALAPLGHTHYVAYEGHAGHAALRGFGDANERYLLLKAGTPAPHATHLAFGARSRRAVDEFHRAALAAGGRDHGAPGPRPHYFDGYYAAYVLDPDGYNIEALCQRQASRQNTR